MTYYIEDTDNIVDLEVETYADFKSKRTHIKGENSIMKEFKKTKNYKKLAVIGALTLTIAMFIGCASLSNTINNIKGTLIGQSFTLNYYDDYANNTMTIKGSKVTIGAVTNKVKDTDSSGNTTYKEQQTSVLDITVNGNQTYAVGNTIVAMEDGVQMIDGADIPSKLEKTSGGGFVPFDRYVNNIKNKLGTGKIIVISSQQGVPIGVIQGKEVYFEVPKDLPKMTRLIVDGKSVYIHRANYVILDTSLIE